VNSNNLVCFSDADWAGDDIDRKSVSGCIVLHCGNPISWFSRKQSCVALSTMEAEYIASSISGI
ncbi:Ty1/Copia family ribonuclease HI, partial [Klebsiella pneumoniae]|uniref:Ty1/Copia family ribonuclease HI n=1 Tax=Klebsiella pneumoniae TaxID=573 RepID=UPI0040558F3D